MFHHRLCFFYGAIGAVLTAALLRRQHGREADRNGQGNDMPAKLEMTALADLTVRCSDERLGSFHDDSGWSYYDTDLNQGSGGKWIYVG